MQDTNNQNQSQHQTDQYQPNTFVVGSYLDTHESFIRRYYMSVFDGVEKLFHIYTFGTTVGGAIILVLVAPLGPGMIGIAMPIVMSWLLVPFTWLATLIMNIIHLSKASSPIERKARNTLTVLLLLLPVVAFLLF